MAERGYLPGAIVKKTKKKYSEPATIPYYLWAVVEHIAEGGVNTWQWLQTTGPGSSHFFVTFDGDIYQFASIYERTWGNGLKFAGGKWIDPQGDVVVPKWHRCSIRPAIDPNLTTISVEHQGFIRNIRTPEMIRADVTILQYIHHETGLVYIVDDTLIRHADISPINRSFCPGPNFNMHELAQMSNTIDPLRARKITDGSGRDWFCGTGFFDYYNQFGQLRAFGHPISDEHWLKDMSGEWVTVMKYERQWLKFKPSETPWSIRPMLTTEIIALQLRG